MRLIALIVRGGLALVREAGGGIARAVSRFERGWTRRGASVPAALIEGGALFARAVLKSGGEALLLPVLLLCILLLFVLLR